MTCPPHEWNTPPPRTDDHGTYVDTVQIAGKACARCGKPKGKARGIASRESRNKQPPTGNVPAWLAEAAREGTWNARLPASRERVREVEELVRLGIVDADFIAHKQSGRLVVATVYLSGPPPATPRELRQRELLAQRPDLNAWAARARLDEIETALRILAISNYRDKKWPQKVWNAAAREHSKSGNASKVATALGATPIERASTHAIWFYGTGTIRAGDRILRVEGEAVYPEAWLRGAVSTDAPELAIIENRDLASLCPGLVMALDGQCTPTQLHIVAQLAGRTPTWCWPDVDGAGVIIARAMKQANPEVRILGLHTWPEAWAREQEPTQALQALDARRTSDEWKPVLDYVLRVGWFEQERIFAELDRHGDPWHLIKAPPMTLTRGAAFERARQA